MKQNFDAAYRYSIEQPEQFWAEQAENVFWYKKWDKVLDDSDAPHYRWFAGGVTNACYNAVDRHVENGRADQDAIIYDSPITGAKGKLTYKELHDRVSRFAGVLRSQGVEKGDRVIVYMPMIWHRFAWLPP